MPDWGGYGPHSLQMVMPYIHQAACIRALGPRPKGCDRWAQIFLTRFMGNVPALHLGLAHDAGLMMPWCRQLLQSLPYVAAVGPSSPRGCLCLNRGGGLRERTRSPACKWTEPARRMLPLRSLPQGQPLRSGRRSCQPTQPSALAQLPAHGFSALPGPSCSALAFSSSTASFLRKGPSFLGQRRLGGRSVPHLQEVIRQDVSVSGSQNPDVEVQDGGQPSPNPGQSNGTYNLNINANGAAALSLPGNGAASISPAGGAQAPAADDGRMDLAGIPHRWRIVMMISVAFVLCNMDKVGLQQVCMHDGCPAQHSC